MTMRTSLPSLVFSLIVVIAGCSKPIPVQAPASPPPPADTLAARQESMNSIDACSLLMTKEIEAIQGTALKDTKRSASSQGGLTVSQCYFLLPMTADSIVVTVTQRSTGEGGRDPKQSWDEIFHSDKEKANAGKEGEKEEAVPEQITSIGDEAFWVSRRFGGKLYVLKGNIYITIGLGSPGDQAAKIQKTKALAEMVLKRL